jgi:hypothetical protein
MTIDNLLDFIENHNRIEVNFDEEDKVELILQIDHFERFYPLINYYTIDNEIFLKVISEIWFSLDITDILNFYEIDIKKLYKRINKLKKQ